MQELRNKQHVSRLESSKCYLALSWLDFHDPVINYPVQEKEERPASRIDFK